MITQLELDQAIMVQIHRNGKWTRVRPALQVFKNNVQHLITREPVEWISVAIAPNTMLGNKKLQEVRKEIQKIQNGKIQ